MEHGWSIMVVCFAKWPVLDVRVWRGAREAWLLLGVAVL
jgi:hypothetical protein